MDFSSHRLPKSNTRSKHNEKSSPFCKLITILVSVIWFCSVIKVFLLESKKHDHQIIRESNPSLIKIEANGSVFYHTVSYPLVKVAFRQADAGQLSRSSHGSTFNQRLPRASEWDSMRYIRAVKPPQPDELLPKPVDGNIGASSSIFTGDMHSKNMHQLSWPPILLDGSIPEADGNDTMPLTGIKVPRFWEPPVGADLFKTGSRVNDLETIFMMIASYRDFQCRETITSAFKKADHPERLFIAAVDQVVEGDIGCLDIEIPCSVNADQPICKYRNQISVYKMDAELATGPVTARHIGDRMYRGEYFVTQMDAHCLFVRHWDTLIINQWRSTGNEMAVLTSYLTDTKDSIDGNGDSLRDTRPIMCNSDFEGMMPARYLRHGAQPEEIAVVREMPQLEPFWAAGFSFSRGHFKVQVPYDGYQAMVFQGEEISIGIRGFTYGYDFYAPRDSVVFHEYADYSSRRKKIHMFWENGGAHTGEGGKSLRRSMSIIKMSPDVDPTTYDHSEESKYGLGKVRDVALFYKLFMIDTVKRKAVQLCPFVRSGRMHHDFQKFLRKDGMGIDYSQLESFDISVVLQRMKSAGEYAD